MQKVIRSRSHTVTSIIDSCLKLRELIEDVPYETFATSWVLVSATERQLHLLANDLQVMKEGNPGLFDEIPNAPYVLALGEEIAAGQRPSADRLYACCSSWPSPIVNLLAAHMGD